MARWIAGAAFLGTWLKAGETIVQTNTLILEVGDGVLLCGKTTLLGGGDVVTLDEADLSVLSGVVSVGVFGSALIQGRGQRNARQYRGES
jgi:hypothetical protein